MFSGNCFFFPAQDQFVWFSGWTSTSGRRRAVTRMAVPVTECSWLWVSDDNQSSHHYACHSWRALSHNSKLPQTSYLIITRWLFRLWWCSQTSNHWGVFQWKPNFGVAKWFYLPSKPWYYHSRKHLKVLITSMIIISYHITSYQSSKPPYEICWWHKVCEDTIWISFS